MRWWVAWTVIVAAGCGGEEFISPPRILRDAAVDSGAVLDASSDGTATDSALDGSGSDAHAEASDVSPDRDARETDGARDTTANDSLVDSTDDGRGADAASQDVAGDALRDPFVDSFDATLDVGLSDAPFDIGRDTPLVDCSMTVIAVTSMNHGHSLQIPPADIALGLERIYNARGAATHDHFVLLTANDFQSLRAGGTVFKRSCNSGDHEYALACVAPSRQPGVPSCSDECGLTQQALCP